MSDQVHFDFTQHAQALQPQQLEQTQLLEQSLQLQQHEQSVQSQQAAQFQQVEQPQQLQQSQPESHQQIQQHVQAQAPAESSASGVFPAHPSQLAPESVSQPATIAQPASATTDAWAAANAAEARARMELLDKEAAKLRELHSQMNAEHMPPALPTDDEKRDGDARSIYIGNVDYGATPLELQQHFSEAGAVNRVTIMMNKLTGQPKGFAYLEFADEDSVNKAVATLDGSLFRERELKVSAKRTNIPGLSATARGGFRGRGRGGPRGGFRGGFRGRGGRGRGAPRGAPRFTPY